MLRRCVANNQSIISARQGAAAVTAMYTNTLSNYSSNPSPNFSSTQYAATSSTMLARRRLPVTTSAYANQVRMHSSSTPADTKNQTAIVRWSKAGWEALRHLYHGFRLFALNTKMAWVYSRRLKSGTPLTRRERLLLERATKDLLRLVPFSVFLIVPFAEFLLPVALKIFPELIPSTFETDAQGKNKSFQKNLGNRMARKRLQEYMAMQVLHYDHANKISDVLRRASSGDPVHYDHIKTISPMCAKNGPLSVQTIPFDVLVPLAKVCGVYQRYHGLMPQSMSAPRLRTAVLEHYRKLRKDDQQLKDEGLTLLTSDELVKANFARGMRWTETDEALMAQLDMWLRCAGDAEIPYNTLFWVKPTEHSLHRTMMELPIETRRKLLGISNLPISVRESLERVIENVNEDRDTQKDDVDADDLAEIVKSTKEDFDKAATKDLGKNACSAEMAAYLNDAHIEALFSEIEGKGKTGPVTISDIIEYLAPDVHQSSHEVSKVFDILEMGKGSDRITRGTLQAFAKRLRAIHEEGNKENQKEAAKKDKETKKIEAPAAAATTPATPSK